MLDPEGNLLSSPEAIEKAALKTYENRLKNRPIKEGLEQMRKVKEDLCNLRLNIASKNKTEPWTLDIRAIGCCPEVFEKEQIQRSS